jgi:outer membrane protein OmpA-like peptidoglycan-associated protein
MNTINYSGVNLRRTLIATTVATVLLAACAAAPLKPDGAAEVRSKLTRLQSDPNLAGRAPLAIKEADAAVRTAEQPQADTELAAHRVYLADRKVETARAQAETRLAEDQRAALSAQRESARLDARTREADAARSQAATARAESAEQGLAADRRVAAARAESAEQGLAADRQVATARAEGAEQKLAADQARSESDAARVAAANSEQQTTELQRQIEELQARVTDRGLVLTLGDVLFETGRADLRTGTGNLNKLVLFLNKHPDRTVAIEGYTDSVGSQDYNQALSQRRADSVRSYLVRQGIGSGRLTASGMGTSDPVAGNDSAAGRQQNRRVEVIISNPSAALR